MLLVGGGGSGKSYFSFQRAIIRCLLDKRKYLIFRKIGVDVRRSCFEDVKNQIKDWNLSSICNINETEMSITFKNGSKMLFLGLDNQERIRSISKVTDAIVEECSEITLDDFSQIKMRLRGKGRLKNQIVLQCNPVSKNNWVFKHFFKDGCKENDCRINQSTYKDNPHLNQETINALEGYKTTNPYFYRVYCLGQWGSISKQVFTNYESRDLNLDELRRKKLPQLVGLDFGYVNDETAIVVSLLDEENKELFIINEYASTGLLNSDIAAQLKAMGLEKATIVADSAEQKSIDEIKRLGIRRIVPATKGAGSVNQGIQQLQQYKLIVDSSCEFLLEELENYSYKKDKQTGEYTNEPIDKYNHAIDALRYSLQCVKHKSKLKSLPKYSL